MNTEINTADSHAPHVHKLADAHATGLVTRTLDALDRGHARAAMRAHDARNATLAAVARGIDRLEAAVSAVLDRARKAVQKADTASADAVNRAQGLVGHAIERARLARAGAAN